MASGLPVRSVLALLCWAVELTACAGAKPEAEAPQADGDRREVVPELLRHEPWSTSLDAMGFVQHSHHEARLRFTSSVVGIDLTRIQVFDEATNDVGMFYVAELSDSEPLCLIRLSVFVYPATEALDRHLEQVKGDLIAHNPGASPSEHVLNLDAAHGEGGVQAGYINTRDGLELYEGVSLFQRGRWFVKYRLTIAPPGKPACDQRVRDAVTALQAR